MFTVTSYPDADLVFPQGNNAYEVLPPGQRYLYSSGDPAMYEYIDPIYGIFVMLDVYSMKIA